MKQTQTEKIEAKQARASFAWMVAMAKRKGALHSVEIVKVKKTNSIKLKSNSMKFHLTIDNNKSVCGAVVIRPDTFVYNEKGFTSHLAKEYQCKKCLKIFLSLNPAT